MALRPSDNEELKTPGDLAEALAAVKPAMSAASEAGSSSDGAQEATVQAAHHHQARGQGDAKGGKKKNIAGESWEDLGSRKSLLVQS